MYKFIKFCGVFTLVSLILWNVAHEQIYAWLHFFTTPSEWYLPRREFRKWDDPDFLALEQSIPDGIIMSDSVNLVCEIGDWYFLVEEGKKLRNEVPQNHSSKCQPSVRNTQARNALKNLRKRATKIFASTNVDEPDESEQELVEFEKLARKVVESRTASRFEQEHLLQTIMLPDSPNHHNQRISSGENHDHHLHHRSASAITPLRVWKPSACGSVWTRAAKPRRYLFYDLEKLGYDPFRGRRMQYDSENRISGGRDRCAVFDGGIFLPAPPYLSGRITILELATQNQKYNLPLSLLVRPPSWPGDVPTLVSIDTNGAGSGQLLPPLPSRKLIGHGLVSLIANRMQTFAAINNELLLPSRISSSPAPYQAAKSYLHFGEEIKLDPSDYSIGNNNDETNELVVNLPPWIVIIGDSRARHLVMRLMEQVRTQFAYSSRIIPDEEFDYLANAEMRKEAIIEHFFHLNATYTVYGRKGPSAKRRTRKNNQEQQQRDENDEEERGSFVFQSEWFDEDVLSQFSDFDFEPVADRLHVLPEHHGCHDDYPAMYGKDKNGKCRHSRDGTMGCKEDDEDLQILFRVCLWWNSNVTRILTFEKHALGRLAGLEPVSDEDKNEYRNIVDKTLDVKILQEKIDESNFSPSSPTLPVIARSNQQVGSIIWINTLHTCRIHKQQLEGHAPYKCHSSPETLRKVVKNMIRHFERTSTVRNLILLNAPLPKGVRYLPRNLIAQQNDAIRVAFDELVSERKKQQRKNLHSTSSEILFENARRIQQRALRYYNQLLNSNKSSVSWEQFKSLLPYFSAKQHHQQISTSSEDFQKNDANDEDKMKFSSSSSSKINSQQQEQQQQHNMEVWFFNLAEWLYNENAPSCDGIHHMCNVISFREGKQAEYRTDAMAVKRFCNACRDDTEFVMWKELLRAVLA